MPRRASVWLRAEDGFYYCTHRRKKVRLSADRKEAERAFHELKAGREPVDDVGPRPSFRKVADLYLGVVRQTRSARTFEHRRLFLQSFCDHVKAKKAADLKPGDVTDWIIRVNAEARPAGPGGAKKAAARKRAGLPRWGHNTQVTARSVVLACLNWAADEGRIAQNPLARLKAGSTHRRERMLDAEERARVKDAVGDGPFRNLLTFLELTGCRPYSEAAQVTADLIDWKSGTITFLKHKNARKGKSRVVYLVPALQELLRTWCIERPKGPLFVTRNGVPYNRSNVSGRIRRLERDLGMSRWNLYSFRHAFFTEALERGVSSDLLAELGGNTPQTIAKYYSHLEQRKQALAAAALKAVS